MDTTEPTGTTQEPTPSHLPRLSVAEWVTFGVLAALLAVVNIYSTLLIGWGDGGSLIAVIASVMVLGLLGKKTSLYNLNLSQTMVSAGGSVGFAVASYAAVNLVEPDFAPNPWMLGLMFVGMAILGTIVGSSVRKYMVRYYFPSGTACAVIQKTVSAAGEDPESRRPIRLLAVWGTLATLVTVPVKITLEKGGHALVGAWNWAAPKGVPLGVNPDPLLFGIGIVVGPRIGLGMILGSAAPILMRGMLADAGVAEDMYGDWKNWLAIAVLTLPTFASILFAYLFRTPPVIPAGFAPGSIEYGAPPARRFVYGALGLVGLLLTAVGGQLLFDVPFYWVVATVAISWPLCVMNGRVTGDTDINPVRLVAIVLLSVFAFLVAKDAVVLLGIAIVGGTLAGMAVDMMQDYRTGYLVNGNHHHQTSVQFIGAIIGALVAVPFFFLIKATMGFGAGTSLPAPGATIWATVAETFTGESRITAGIILMVIVASIAFSGLSFLTVWPKTQSWMPSIFGIGIGLLLPFHMSVAIFLGGVIKFAITQVYKSRRGDKPVLETLKDAANDTMLVGSSIFAASAIVSVLLIALTELQRLSGWQIFWIAH